MISRRITNLFLAVFLILFSSASFSSGQTGTGRITGKLIVRDAEGISGGEVHFYNIRTGPLPAMEKYWRYADGTYAIGGKGDFSAELPEGKYYMDAVVRLSESYFGPACDGDYYYIDRNKQGDPKIYSVESGKTLDLGVILSAVPFKSAPAGSLTAVEGTVFDVNGNPAQKIVVFANAGDVRLGFASAITGEDGRYLLRVDKGGIYKISIMNLRRDSPPIHGIVIKGYKTGEVSVLTDKTVEGVDIQIIRTRVPGQK